MDEWTTLMWKMKEDIMRLEMRMNELEGCVFAGKRAYSYDSGVVKVNVVKDEIRDYNDQH
jgi:hypothetical protein